MKLTGSNTFWRNVSPCLDVDNVAYGGKVDSKLGGQGNKRGISRPIQFSNLPDGFIRKFGFVIFDSSFKSLWIQFRWVFFSKHSLMQVRACKPTGVLSTGLTPLGTFVGYIFRRCSKEKMVRINTMPNIAFVTNAKTCRNVAFAEPIGDSVSCGVRSILTSIAKLWVSIVEFTSNPNPASIWQIGFFNLAPKSGNIFFGHKNENHRPSKVLSARMEPQSLSSGNYFSDSHVFNGYNRAKTMLSL